ncbi:aliphatic sulfonate ABC transporter substrate-binding protein [Streptomyces sp. NPDC005438]|uniref:aliphatic sulfonate ABC transporter substrate-binding protein n=1 Tax=Streptomyces sp. NPDC005438 TaxID=3156880 RepID=UPI0033ABC894
MTATALAVLPLLLAVGCGYGSQAEESSGEDTKAEGEKLSAAKVNIGYFANTTHASALVGKEKGFFQKELKGTQADYKVFNAGPSEIEALNAGAIDIGWIGPSPAINGWSQSKGKGLKIISGSASGGVALVVNPKKIKSLDDLKGKRIATPQLGNTQDVALLNYLADKGFKVDAKTGKGDVTVQRTENKVTPLAFEQGEIDGAWVPEPTASKLVDVGGKRLLDERKLWKDGKFVITNVIVSQKFLRQHPDVVQAVLRGSVKANDWIGGNPADAATTINAALKKDTGEALPDKIIKPAVKEVDVTDDPLASTLREEAEHAVTAGLLKKPDLDGIYDLRPLNKVLRAEGKKPVDAAGLGQQ